MVPTDIRYDGAMSELGQKRKSGPAILTSVLPSTADIRRRDGHVRKMPNPDIALPYSIGYRRIIRTTSAAATQAYASSIRG